MLTIKGPIQLHIAQGLTGNAEAFGERIRGNYDLLGARYAPKDLLFLLTAPPELPEELGGMTTLVSQQNNVDVRSVTLDVVNQVVNRIMLDGTQQFTYQDQVYITSVLNRLGVTNVEQFMEQIRQLRTQNESTVHLTQLYRSELKNLLARQERGEQITALPLPAKEREEETEVKQDPRVTMCMDVLQRLNTTNLYETIHNFQRSWSMGVNEFRHNELRLAEQLRFSNSVSLAQLKQQIYEQPQINLMHHVNQYETGLILEAPRDEETVLSQAAVAALVTAVDNTVVEVLNRPQLNQEQWVRVEDAVWQTAENTLSRFETYHSQFPVMLMEQKPSVQRAWDHYVQELKEYHMFYRETHPEAQEYGRGRFYDFRENAPLTYLTQTEELEQTLEESSVQVQQKQEWRSQWDNINIQQIYRQWNHNVQGMERLVTQEQIRQETRQKIMQREVERLQRVFRQEVLTQRLPWMKYDVQMTQLPDMAQKSSAINQRTEEETDRVAQAEQIRLLEYYTRILPVERINTRIRQEMHKRLLELRQRVAQTSPAQEGIRLPVRMEYKQSEERFAEEQAEQTALLERYTKLVPMKQVNTEIRQEMQTRLLELRQRVAQSSPVQESVRLPVRMEYKQAEERLAKEQAEQISLLEQYTRMLPTQQLSTQIRQEFRSEMLPWLHLPEHTQSLKLPEMKPVTMTKLDMGEQAVEGLAEEMTRVEEHRRTLQQNMGQDVTGKRSDVYHVGHNIENILPTPEQTQQILTQICQQNQGQLLTGRESGTQLGTQDAANTSVSMTHKLTQAQEPEGRGELANLLEEHTRVMPLEQLRTEVKKEIQTERMLEQYIHSQTPNEEGKMGLLPVTMTAREAEEQAPERLVEEIHRIDQQNRTLLQKIQQDVQHREVKLPNAPDLRRTMKDALRALEEPEQFLTEFHTQKQAQMVHPSYTPQEEAILRQADPADRVLYEKILAYQKNPERALAEGLVKPGNMGVLKAELQKAVQEESLTLEHPVQPKQEENQTRWEESRQILERFGYRPTPTIREEFVPEPPKAVRIVHKQAPADVTQELLERLEQQQTQSTVKTVSDQSVTQKHTQQLDVTQIDQKIVTQTTQDITELVNRTLARQMRTISDQVYRQMEKRLQTERSRRGRL